MFKRYQRNQFTSMTSHLWINTAGPIWLRKHQCWTLVLIHRISPFYENPSGSKINLQPSCRGKFSSHHRWFLCNQYSKAGSPILWQKNLWQKKSNNWWKPGSSCCCGVERSSTNQQEWYMRWVGMWVCEWPSHNDFVLGRRRKGYWLTSKPEIQKNIPKSWASVWTRPRSYWLCSL